MSDLPTDELDIVNIIQSSGYDEPWVEAHFTINVNGDAAQGLTIEFFPKGYPVRFSDDDNLSRAVGDGASVRSLDVGISEEEFTEYAMVTMIFGRLGIHG